MSEIIGKVLSLDVERNGQLELSLKNNLEVEKLKLIDKPNNGRLENKGDSLIYIPNHQYLGEDFFSFQHTVELNGIVALTVKETVFKPRARLLIQLGDQLIKNESIALIELAKNSYDADASYCNVKMSRVESSEGFIVIEDDGFGMDIEIVKNAWLEPGSDNKEIQVKNRQVTSEFNRLPIGEKGIGRFGVHKLGKKIEMISRTEGKPEVVVEIDWEKFKEYKYLDEAPVSIYEREPEFFKNEKTGTRITISSLSKKWTRGMVRDVFRALNGISTPPTYDIAEILSGEDETEKATFKANLITEKIEWIKDIPKWSEVLDYSLFFFDIKIKDDKILKFKYKFRPWDRFSDIHEREITDKDHPIKELLNISDPTSRKYKPLEFNGSKIGTFQFKGAIFIRDRYIFKLFGIQPTSLTDYLDTNGGIRVYRNNVRVYDYGEKENDWLALDYRRFNDPGVKLSNNLMLASINLDREESLGLIEKTNREGFIENEAYNVFKKQVLYGLKLIELLRLDDKRKIDQKYKPKTESETVLQSIESLRGYVKEKIKDKNTRKQLKVYVDRIEKNYKFMNETLLKSASAGLGWSIYVHEIEKIIKEIQRALSKDKVSERVIRLASHLSELIESYAQVLRRTTRTNQSLSNIVDQALFNVEYRLEAHNINIERADLAKPSTNISVSRNLLISNVMNLIDNSIYWLDRSKKDEKIIRFDIAEIEEGFDSLVISDNGFGFSLPPEQMIEPFVSAKPGGMGLGLHIISEVMASHKGKLSFNENGNYKLPKKFEDGATVILSFKKS